ncbi:hypothetical protein ACIRS1_34880 [Kitasatospora sp. NPDC101176]|uniref:hypothetical protein n=1 Tax=Kitasatospora sp. NPDC101176 TaxID=3364099 RepID=UPI0038053B7B
MSENAVLAELCERLPIMAEEFGLQLIPAVPEDHPGRAHVDYEAMAPEELCGLARATGARVLFHRTTMFDAESFLEEFVDQSDDEDSDPARAAETEAIQRLRRRAKRRNGQVEEVELCVILDGIAVFWSRRATWAADLEAEADTAQHEQNGLVEHVRTRRAQDEETEITRIARLLQEDRAFREAKGPGERRRAIERLVPAPRDEDYEAGQMRWRAIRQATSAIEEAAEAVFGDYMTQLTEIADELVASGALDNARTIPARRIHLKKFLSERSGGYAPPADLITLMMELPQLRDSAGTKTASLARQRHEALFPME